MLLIGSISRAYDVMSLRESNCHDSKVKGGKVMLCSVADNVKVFTPGGYMYVSQFSTVITPKELT